MFINYPPSTLVPLVGLVFPGIAMDLLLIYIEKDTIESFFTIYKD